MTEFEQEVAKALEATVKSPCPLCQAHAEEFAPAVAAAIDALANDIAECHNDYADEMGGSRSPDEFPDARAKALATVRGCGPRETPR